ncbi:MAG: Mth938-like domain-containing protein [Nitrospinota bacterium]
MNMIESYGFGKMAVDGKRYGSDLIIFPDKVIPDWRRKEGHNLAIEDLTKVFEYGPEILVVGTGNIGMMKLPEETRKQITDNGIELVAEKTGKAYRSFNELSKTRKVVGAFHLTC